MKELHQVALPHSEASRESDLNVFAAGRPDEITATQRAKRIYQHVWLLRTEHAAGPLLSSTKAEHLNIRFSASCLFKNYVLKMSAKQQLHVLQ